jgi:hypothetical protein
LWRVTDLDEIKALIKGKKKWKMNFYT